MRESQGRRSRGRNKAGMSDNSEKMRKGELKIES